MIFTEVLLFFAISLAIVTLLFHQRSRIRHYREMVVGIQFLNLVNKVLEHLPQHRGMANAFLNGDQDFLAKMQSMQGLLEKDVHDVDEFIASSGLPAELCQRWKLICQEWHGLKDDLSGLSAAESFDRHTAIILQVIYLIGDIADATKITSFPDAVIARIAHTAFNLLPPIIEVVGQARGIGSGAAAKGVLLSAVRIKLEFLRERLGQSAEATYDSLTGYLQQSASCQIDSQQIKNCRQQTLELGHTIGSHLLGNQISISAEEYFSEASIALDHNLKLLSNITGNLGNNIQRAIPGLIFRFWQLLLLGVVSAGGLIILFWLLGA